MLFHIFECLGIFKLHQVNACTRFSENTVKRILDTYNFRNADLIYIKCCLRRIGQLKPYIEFCKILRYLDRPTELYPAVRNRHCQQLVNLVRTVSGLVFAFQRTAASSQLHITLDCVSLTCGHLFARIVCYSVRLRFSVRNLQAFSGITAFCNLDARISLGHKPICAVFKRCLLR